MAERKNMYSVTIGNTEGKRTLGRRRRRWEDGLKMNLRDIGWGVRSGFTRLRIGTVGGLS
jgi:hypothetical protein